MHHTLCLYNSTSIKFNKHLNIANNNNKIFLYIKLQQAAYKRVHSSFFFAIILPLLLLLLLYSIWCHGYKLPHNIIQHNTGTFVWLLYCNFLVYTCTQRNTTLHECIDSFIHSCRYVYIHMLFVKNIKKQLLARK